MHDLELYLHPTYFIDSEHPEIVEMGTKLCAGRNTDVDKAKALFYYVRDTYKYSPYHVSFEHKVLKASHILLREGKKQAYCIEKAVLFAALCRAEGIPNRLLFCNVRNHIGTERFEAVIGTDIMVFHGYNEVFVNDRWVKCTVAFNKGLCDKLGVDTLEFDGIHDEVFQEYSKEGDKFMTYEKEYGTFHDVPHDLWEAETRKYYPHLFTSDGHKGFLKMMDKMQS